MRCKIIVVHYLYMGWPYIRKTEKIVSVGRIIRIQKFNLIERTLIKVEIYLVKKEEDKSTNICTG